MFCHQPVNATLPAQRVPYNVPLLADSARVSQTLLSASVAVVTSVTTALDLMAVKVSERELIIILHFRTNKPLTFHT